jgi:hypothetical protein
MIEPAALKANLEKKLEISNAEISLPDLPHEIEAAQHDYSEVTRSLENLVREALKQRIVEEQINLEAADSLVEIIDLAEPALRPMTSRPLIAGGLFALGLLLLGAALPLIRTSEPKKLPEISQPENAV